MQPERIQLRRTKGWRMPPNTVKVDRSTRWGNPFVGEGPHDRAKMERLFREYLKRPEQAELVAAGRAGMRGKNIGCWCDVPGPCHGNVWLEVANS